MASDVKNWDDIDKWCKAEDINEMGDYDVFIEGATVDDIQQGNIGDCYSVCTSLIYYSGLSIGILIINLYCAKIAWSFNTRLQRGQELLVIHGKYLEQMISNENQKIIDTQNLILQSKYSEIELSNSKPSNIIPSNDENK